MAISAGVIDNMLQIAIAVTAKYVGHFQSGRVCQARRIPLCLGDDSASERRHTRIRDVHRSCVVSRSTRCRQRWLPTFSRPVHTTLCRTHSGVPALAVIVFDCGRRDPASLAHPTSSPAINRAPPDTFGSGGGLSLHKQPTGRVPKLKTRMLMGPTRVSSDGIWSLRRLANLKVFFLDGTNSSRDAVESLSKARPDLTIYPDLATWPKD